MPMTLRSTMLQLGPAYVAVPLSPFGPCGPVSPLAPGVPAAPAGPAGPCVPSLAVTSELRSLSLRVRFLTLVVVTAPRSRSSASMDRFLMSWPVIRDPATAPDPAPTARTAAAARTTTPRERAVEK
ncbi:hypothetical protein EUA94_17255 [Nocardioides zhouii]|uniref:Uncharacterized protein n=1 Tax=Nocardioides zhouii TaxID=1168729 RepID=A0A4Q2SLE2_9ACTN|nr:hypothetical protein EUA94_17255 [Nocardioides zhouii]